tara:strand:+ start:308 stop:877 length:570 start_codon:yes stop_codon:yes gene_type:complete
MTTPKFDLYWRFPDPHEPAELGAITATDEGLLAMDPQFKPAHFGSMDLIEIAGALVRRGWAVESLVLTDSTGTELDEVRTSAYGQVLAYDINRHPRIADHTLSTELRMVYVDAVVLTRDDKKIAFGRRTVTTATPEEFCNTVTALTTLANRPRPMPKPKPKKNSFWNRLLAPREPRPPVPGYSDGWNVR